MGISAHGKDDLCFRKCGARTGTLPERGVNTYKDDEVSTVLWDSHAADFNLLSSWFGIYQWLLSIHCTVFRFISVISAKICHRGIFSKLDYSIYRKKLRVPFHKTLASNRLSSSPKYDEDFSFNTRLQNIWCFHKKFIILKNARGS